MFALRTTIFPPAACLPRPRRASSPEPRPSHRRPRHGSVIVIVLWTISIAAIVVTSIQLFAYRQSTLGHESVHRVQARWAARAGIENAIAMMALHTQQPIPNDGMALTRDLWYIAQDELHNATYDIQHHTDARDLAGPMDEHSKLNINRGDFAALELLQDITPDVVAAIADWMDEDDEPSFMGAESDYYLANYTYEPRNGPFRNIAELELVAGIWPGHLRGEDHDLDGRMDANENDGTRSLPEDEPDGWLDAGWSGMLTTHSVAGGATESGLPRIHLRWATPEEVMERCGLDEQQAQVVLAFGKKQENTLEQLLVTPLSYIDGQGAVQATEVSPEVDPLEDEQLRAVLTELSITPLFERLPGKINLNTASSDLIRDLLELNELDDAIADELIYMRSSRPEGIGSLLDLLSIPGITPDQVSRLARIFTTTSNVFTISSSGKSQSSNIEVEIIAVVDRSTVPVRILEYREQ